MNKKQLWRYGVDPNPRSWAETAEILKAGQTSKPKKSSGLYDRLLQIETLLKEKKQ